MESHMGIDFAQGLLGIAASRNVSLPIAATTARPSHQSVLADSATLPVYAAGVSLVVLTLQVVRSLLLRQRARLGDTNAEELGRQYASKGHVAAHGGLRIFAFHVLRVLACLALLGLTLTTFVFDAKSGTDPNDPAASKVWRYGVLITSTYATALAIASVTTRPPASVSAVRHVNSVLLVLLAVYLYRDVWPLATFSLQPLDLQEGPILWAKIVVLSVACVVVPLCIPRRRQVFLTVEGSDLPESLEETSSLLSLVTYAWMDGTIAEASRVSHLPAERLPVIATTDHVEYLIKRSFKHLDPMQVKKRRHAFFSLMRIFWAEYVSLGLLLLLRYFARVMQPLTLRYLLSYLENGGEGATVRPWLWVALLFVSPAIYCIGFQWYSFLVMKTAVQAKAIITQLVFDHALRARVRSETSSSDNAADKTAVATPETASVAEQDNRAAAGSPTGSEETAVPSATLTDSDTSTGPKGENKDMVGKITNLVSTDMDNIMEGRDYLFFVTGMPPEAGFTIYFLYTILGWSAFTGLAVILLSFPIIAYCSTFGQDLQTVVMKKSDARVQSVTDVLGVVRMVKLFGWESRVSQQLDEKREEELKYKLKFKLITFLTRYAAYIAPLFTVVVTFFTYTIVMKRELTASVVFTSISLLDMLRDGLAGSFWEFPRCIQAKVSLDRLTDFLYETELLDDYDVEVKPSVSAYSANQEHQSENVEIRNASFTWGGSNDGASTPASDKKFVLRIDELIFKRGAINLIVGPTGCGKTSLLMALLGEMHYLPSGPGSVVRLPRNKGVAYAPQEAWVLNRTIRENILFGSPFDEERYNKVIEQCSLRRDLSLFEAGDNTEVGEKGLTLSGGQKARVTLARAVYSSAEVLILDDVLAALDVHTARWIVERCFTSDLLNNRTVILVTHNVALTSPVSDFVVSLGPDGKVRSQGPPSEVFEQDKEISAMLARERKQLERGENEVDTTNTDEKIPQTSGKLFVPEEVEEGRVGWAAIIMFLKSAGGNHLLLFWTFTLALLFADGFCEVLSPWVLSVWVSQYSKYPASEVRTSYYLTLYSLVIVINVAVFSIVYVFWIYGVVRASREIYRKLVNSVLFTTLRWLDTTPTSRIISRCTQDINAIENVFADSLNFWISMAMGLFLRLAAILSISPLFTVPSAIVGVIGMWVGRLYLSAVLCVKRENSNAQAPVLDNVGAAISGLVTIRAYGAQEAFRKEGFLRMDKHTKTNMAMNNLRRWVTVRMEMLGAVFSSGLAAYLVYGNHGVKPSDVGYSMAMAINFTAMMFWFILSSTETEISANSLERIRQYVDIELEPKSSPSGVPPAYWPASGKLTVEKLSARYSVDGPRVLHDISFEVQPGERVGVVGRTGSGKSSLTLALLRCIDTEGKVYYDGLSTDSLNLDALRTSITIIPQIPELLSGTVRDNLDPFQERDDAELNDALRTAGLYSLQNEGEEGRIMLDTQVAGAGGNLSVGQRQILALARAIVRQSKLLILDEATSAIDYHTDTVIQESLRKAVGKDVTLLIIAHRLQTIMDANKIMVLDAGRIVEFDSPSNLLRKEGSVFKAMVDGSGDKEKLYALAISTL